MDSIEREIMGALNLEAYLQSVRAIVIVVVQLLSCV